jgi:hypothetical protein
VSFATQNEIFEFGIETLSLVIYGSEGEIQINPIKLLG